MDTDGGSLPPAVTQNQLLKHLLDVKGLGPGRLIGDVAQRREKSPKDLEVSVFQTLLVKSITEDHNGALFLVGTLIQRTIGVDLEAVRAAGRIDAPFPSIFQYRMNEAPLHDGFEIRKSSLNQMLDDNGERLPVSSRATTIAVTLPLKLITIMSAGPFQIISASVLLELTSFNDDHFTYRPSYVGQVEDNRNTVSVRDWNKPTLLNTTRAYDIVNPNPIVQVHYDVKGKGASAVRYAPKMEISFYLNNKSTTSQFVRSLMPVLFAAVAQTVNHVGSDLDLAMYITNALLIGLIVVFTIPAIPRDARRKIVCFGGLGLHDLYVILLFTGLGFGLVDQTVGLPGHALGWRLTSVGLLYLACCIPVFHFFEFLTCERSIRAASPAKDAPDTFCGRPGGGKSNKRGGDAVLSNLQPFAAEINPMVRNERGASRAMVCVSRARTGADVLRLPSAPILSLSLSL